ncbi:cysteine desulfurase family protein [uncultured Corynebacterium sp.]|uniref:cysteine desulfurase family protein n=1 Tax=uncultured Corynebacterium sp. TaxID=159447 RepID=UPI0025E2104B|nr:cysteine desulfurase family protein [uncultured Corynebacterium sp.]
MGDQRRVYLDHAASAPMRPEAAAALVETTGLLNPAGQYVSGRDASRTVEDAREQIGELLGADRAEVIFTGSGTEADNIAVQGLAFGALRTRGARRIHVSAVEHPAVGESVDWLCGGLPVPEPLFERMEIPVDAAGRPQSVGPLDPAADALVTAMWVNNETGNITDLPAVLRPAVAAGVPTHVDAVQAVGHLPVDFRGLGVSSLAASAHKFGGPKSVGILLARRDAVIDTPLRGGGQERKLRSGTVNPQGAAATAAALAAAVAEMDAEHARLAGYRARLLEVVHSIPDAVVHTDASPTGPGALPSHVHVSFPGAEGDSLIMLLDVAGVDASTGSACSSGVNRASHVLTAMGVDVHTARGALRLTTGPATTDTDIDRICALLPGVVEQARAAGTAY